jgi:hypothetical protein
MKKFPLSDDEYRRLLKQWKTETPLALLMLSAAALAAWCGKEIIYALLNNRVLSWVISLVWTAFPMIIGMSEAWEMRKEEEFIKRAVMRIIVKNWIRYGAAFLFILGISLSLGLAYEPSWGSIIMKIWILFAAWFVEALSSLIYETQRTS